MLAARRHFLTAGLPAAVRAERACGRTHVSGAEVVALPVLQPPATVDAPVLGPGAEEVGEALGLDLLALLESAGARGAAGEV